ncbi:MAG TPA: hypothetical protein VJB08_03090 [Candidatus Nanoarchaeia archaeon]|nr:hypothetical protein [Candidatus Nanoarchaeia archaeon]
MAKERQIIVSQNTALILGILVIASLGISVYNLVSIKAAPQNSITGAATSQQAQEVQEFLNQVTSIQGLEQYRNVNPLAIIQINEQNIAELQQQIAGVTNAHLGEIIIEYPNAIFIYDARTGSVARIISTQEAAANAILQRLNSHAELGDLRQITPAIGVISNESLIGLKAQYPSYFNDVTPGQLLVKYPQHLVVYDAQADTIQKIFTISEQLP